MNLASREFELFELTRNRMVIDGFAPLALLELEPQLAYSLKLYHRIGLEPGMSKEAVKALYLEKLHHCLALKESIQVIYRHYYLLGECCFHLGEMEAAEDFWNDCLLLNNIDMKNWCYIHLGHLGLEKNEWNQAIKWFNLVSCEPNSLLQAEQIWGKYLVAIGLKEIENAAILLSQLLIIRFDHREVFHLWKRNFTIYLSNTDGDFSKFIRGVSSIFSDNAKKLADMKQAIKKEMIGNRDTVASHVCSIAFHKVLDLKSQLFSIIESPFLSLIKEVTTNLDAVQQLILNQENKLSTMQADLKEWKQKLLALELPLYKWERQLSEGVLYNNGKVYSMR